MSFWLINNELLSDILIFCEEVGISDKSSWQFCLGLGASSISRHFMPSSWLASWILGRGVIEQGSGRLSSFHSSFDIAFNIFVYFMNGPRNFKPGEDKSFIERVRRGKGVPPVMFRRLQC